MSTPEQPANPPLTRKQIREIRNTGSTPVITPEEIDQAPSDAPEANSVDSGGGAPSSSCTSQVVSRSPVTMAVPLVPCSSTRSL